MDAQVVPVERKVKKKKVLLMGKSGSGKSSMRSIIFSNYVALDTRRLGVTIDVEHSHVKFLGNLNLNLWDCGGQDAFMETYLNTQRDHVFSSVAILIYVFDAESKEFERDLITYASVVRALHENSPSAAVFCLIHKMDLVPESFHDKIYEQRKKAVVSRTEFFDITCFPTSIWTHTLYKAWGDIVYTLIPNMNQIKFMLEQVGEGIEAEEIILFERTTFLPVCTVCSSVGDINPDKSRHEKISNIIKVFKQSISRHTGQPRSSAQFREFHIKTKVWSLLVTQLTTNTVIWAALPPGECIFNSAKLNIEICRQDFEELDVAGVTAGTGNAGLMGSNDAGSSAGNIAEESITEATGALTKSKTSNSSAQASYSSGIENDGGTRGKSVEYRS